MEIAAAVCLGTQKPKQTALFQQTAAGLMRPGTGHFRPQRKIESNHPNKEKY